MFNGHDLNGSKVAILATDGFEESELSVPLEALREAGADAKIVSIPESARSIRAWSGDGWDGELEVDGVVGDDFRSDDFDALVLPGGVINPDRLRRNGDAVDFVRGFFEAGKPVAAICHGPWMIVEAGAADGRTMTSWSSLRTDLRNAGADWVDEEVVVDEGLVTSRSPDDLDAFVEKMLEEIGEGIHREQHA